MFRTQISPLRCSSKFPDALKTVATRGIINPLGPPDKSQDKENRLFSLHTQLLYPTASELGIGNYTFSNTTMANCGQMVILSW